MVPTPRMEDTQLEINASTPGETLETKIEKLMHTKEPMTDGATPLIFTPRAEGIRASTNIRTDRWEIAIEATDKIARSYMARREERAAKTKAEAEKQKAETEAKKAEIQNLP